MNKFHVIITTNGMLASLISVAIYNAYAKQNKKTKKNRLRTTLDLFVVSRGFLGVVYTA